MRKINNFKRFLSEGKKDVFPNIKKMDIDGFTVYVGGDAKSNDHLTFNIADSSDILPCIKLDLAECLILILFLLIDMSIIDK